MCARLPGAAVVPAVAADQEPDRDEDENRHPGNVRVTAEQGKRQDHGEDGERGHRHAGGPGPPGADRSGAGRASAGLARGGGGRGNLALAGQVSEQGGQVRGGAGLKGTAGAVL